MSVIPIAIIVLVINATITHLESWLILRFLIGALIIILGLGIFLFGAGLAISEIGKLMGNLVAKSKNVPFIFMMGLFLGFLITVAEPDLLILANQVSTTWGGVIEAMFIVLVVSLGVGLMVGLGFLRMLFDKPMPVMFAIFYLSMFVMFLFVPEQFQAIAFDSSGATTGAMTTPFLLALGLGVSRRKGSVESEKDSFGMVGTASMGPILAVMIMSLFVKVDPNTMVEETFEIQQGILAPILHAIPPMLKDSLIALAPLAILFFIVNHFKFKLKRRPFRRIIVGLIYTFIGLVMFLVGVHSGFMDIAALFGQEIALHPNQLLLPAVGFLIGMVVVLAEPAVYVLSMQVQDVTAGHIPRKMILIALSIGVAIAVALAMLRIMIPWLKLWMLLVPGFLTIILISFRIPDIFVGIAYDSGGVASGPMTATFILAMTQGAARVLPTANVVIEGFGVIALVAMMPILAIMVLGLLFKARAKKEGIQSESKM